MSKAFSLLRPLVHTIPPEYAHDLGLFALKHGLLPAALQQTFPQLATDFCGLHFKNPVGIAAGFDKNAVAINALFDQGFGYIEAGTVTPKPQTGNAKPRVFRLQNDNAVINRLGFNNEGLDMFIENFKRRYSDKGLAGANIGKNKDSSDAVADYVTGLEAVYPYADYVTVNISSPNTQGLRALQEGEALHDLLSNLKITREKLMRVHSKRVPVFLKIAPDLDDTALKNIAEIVMEQQLDAVIISNTTISRPNTLQSPQASETGGLSGKPLLELSNERLKQFYRLTEGRLPLIGVGGIASAQDAYSKIRCGASLIQLYTAIIYQGFSVVNTINKGLVTLLKKDGLTHLSQAVGLDAK
jgi:dihydroorotate dehydrogenase